MTQKRELKGIPTAGRFAAEPRADPDLALSPAGRGTRLDLPEDSFQGRRSGDPDVRPEDWVFGEDSSIDAAVGTVMDGPLSRGVVNAQRRDAFHA